MSNEQPEALRLIERLPNTAMYSVSSIWAKGAAAELKRLHDVNQELVEALEDILSELYGEVDGPVFDYARAAIAKAKGESND